MEYSVGIRHYFKCFIGSVYFIFSKPVITDDNHHPFIDVGGTEAQRGKYLAQSKMAVNGRSGIWTQSLLS